MKKYFRIWKIVHLMNEKYLQFLGVRGVVGVAAHPDHGGGLPHPLPGALLPRRLQPPAAPHQPIHRQLGQGGVKTQTVVLLFYILTLVVSRSRVASPLPSTASGPRPVCGPATPSCATARISSGRRGSSTPPSPAILVTPG